MTADQAVAGRHPVTAVVVAVTAWLLAALVFMHSPNEWPLPWALLTVVPPAIVATAVAWTLLYYRLRAAKEPPAVAPPVEPAV